MATVVAFLFTIAIPLAVSANASFTNFSADRTAITAGESITISVTTNEQTQFVFAMANGIRTQGTRGAGNNWTVVVTPTSSTSIVVFANTSNTEAGAARINIPVSVSGTAPVTPVPPIGQVPPTVPVPPANLGPVQIASVTETQANQANFVQLTVVTGIEANEVWVNFDRVNNARGTGRFVRGTLQSQGVNHKIWVLNFRPSLWIPQRVEVGSNRTYNWPGAATQPFDVTLSQQFTRAVNPTIQGVTVSPRNVSSGANTTFTIRTNADVEHVWIRTVDGVEHTATRQSTSNTTRNWSISFNPGRSGVVTVFANSVRADAGAATRTENVNVGATVSQRAAFVGTPSASWTGGTNNNNIRITATTNESTNSVWAVLPNGNRASLNRTNSGVSGNRTWELNTWDWGWGSSSWDWGWDWWGNNNQWDWWNQGGYWDTGWNNWGGNITIHASNQSGTTSASEDSRTISVGNWQGGNWGGNIQVSPSSVQNITRGG